MAIQLTAPVVPLGPFTSPEERERAFAQYNAALAAYNDALAQGYASDVGYQGQQLGSTTSQAIAALTNAGQLNVANAQGLTAKEIANLNNQAALQQLQAQIAGQSGIATAEQTAEMNRLQAQIASAEREGAATRSFQGAESAAERAARMAELEKTQSGAQALATKEAQLQQETEQQRYLRALAQSQAANTQVQNWMNQFGLTSGALPVAGDINTGATDAQERAAEDAAFARAKDKIGLASRSAMDSLSSEMSSRGISGSGVEAQRLGGVYESGLGEIGQTAREQAIEALKRKYQVSDRNVALASTTRGQNIGLLSSLSQMTKPTGGGIY